MKLVGFLGIEDHVIVMEKETDLYPVLDYIQSKMVDLDEAGNKKAGKCAQFISELMRLTEEAGFGSDEDIENIEHYIG